jgi:hypothetical protein
MSPETRAFLGGVRDAEDPNAEDQRRVLAAVRATLAGGAAAGASLSAPKAAKLLGTSASYGLKALGALVGLGAAAWLVSSTPRFRQVEHRNEPQQALPRDQRLPTTKALAPVPSALPPVTPPVQASPWRSPSPSPSRSPTVSGEPRQHARVARPASLREEISLLADVQAALERGDGAKALARLDGHVTADRQLLAERSAARILALCLLGRDTEAQRAALAFTRAHPTSVQPTAVERSCAGPKKSRDL